MASIQEALAFAALADSPTANLVPSGWEPLTPPPFLPGVDHGLSYAVYVNTSTKQIVIAFGSEIDPDLGGSAYQYIQGLIDKAVLQTPTSPGALALMGDAANIATSIFQTTQPGYSGLPIATINGNNVGAGYTVFVTGAGIGGAAAEYAMEQVLSQYPVAQTNDLISGMSFGGTGLSNATSFQSGVDFKSYVLQSDGLGSSPLVPNHVGTTIPLGPTNQDYTTDVVVPGLAAAILPGVPEAVIASKVIKKAADTFIKGSDVVDYANALFQQGSIQSNPLTSLAPLSSLFNFNLQSIFSSITNYVQTLNSLSNTIDAQSGTISVDGVTQVISLTDFSDGTASLTVSDDPVNVIGNETTSFGSSGDVLLNQIVVDSATITTSGSESDVLANGTDGALIVIFSPDNQALGDFELIANPDGSSVLVGVSQQTGDAEEVASFSSGGITNDVLNVDENSAGTINVILSIQNGDTAAVNAEYSLANITQNFFFSGAGGDLELGDANTFAGSISDFQPGDTIDLSGIVATGATLGAGNVLTVDENKGGSISLQLDPNETFSSDGFSVNSDSNGGTDVTIEPPLIGIGYDSTSGTNFLESINPTTGIASVLNSFKFDTGFWAESTFLDTETDIFAVSSDGLLYDFNASTGTLQYTLSVGDIGLLSGTGDSLTGFGYNSANKMDYLESIDPATKQVTVLSSFPALLAELGPDPFFANATDAFYFIGGNTSTIYDFSAATGVLKSSFAVAANIEALATGPGNSLLAIAYNQSGSNNSLDSIDLSTGNVTALNTFAFSSGYWDLYTFTDNGTDAFAISENGLLYDFNSTTGALKGTYAVEGLEALRTSETTAACFVTGTRILTPRGEVAVEDLMIEDTVIAHPGQEHRIKWIGVRSYDGRFIAGQHLVLPVCVKRGALAENVPARDLRLSPGHAIYVDGVLIPAWRLINGVSIIQAPSVESVTYYHIELDEHEVIFAEGCPTESFVDDNCRNQFQNSGEFYALYPDDTETEKVSCFPRVESGFHLQAIQHRLAGRAGIAPAAEQFGPLRGFVDQAGPDVLAGWAQCEIQPEVAVCLDVLVDGRRVARVLANDYRADLRAAGLGSGCHAFEIRLPPNLAGPAEVRRSADHAPLPLTDAALARAA